MIEASAGELPAAIGPYRVEEVIGSGGVGVVYRASHEQTGEVVAIKTVGSAREGHLASVRREIEMLKQIRHRGIVRIFDGGVFEGRPWYAMELLEGKTFASWIPRITAELEPSPDGVSCRPPSGGREGLADASTVDEVVAAVRAPSKGAPSAPASALSRSAPVVLGPPPAALRDAGRWARPGTAIVAAPIRIPTPTPKPIASASRLSGILDVLTAMRRLCTPLAFLHGEGMVHRDLKPTNIFIRPEGTPVLMDFGLAWRAHGSGGREVLEAGAGRSGTAGYMAPEQINGNTVDARTDLYALGCILYEAVTGELPFDGSTDEILSKHLYLPAPAPSLITPDVPAGLEELILRLLAKRPRDRLGHANDVAEALARLGAKAWSFTEDAQPRAYLYRPNVSGRDEVIGKLAEALDQTKQGHGGMVLMTGESGIGKTAVAAELIRAAGDKGFRVVTGECVAVSVAQSEGQFEFGAQRGAPLHPFGRLLQAVADRCTARGPEEAERLLGPRLKVLAACEPSLAAVPAVMVHPDPPRLPAQAAQTRLLDALAETMARFAEDRPLLLVIDDLQWADEVSVKFFEALPASFFSTRRLLVVATCRSEEMTAGLEQILARPFVTHVELGRLGGLALARLIADMLALGEAPPGIVDFLTAESTGNPFFVGEYLRAAVTLGLLVRDADGRWELARAQEAISGLSLPKSLHELLERRLEGLTPPVRWVAEMGAVLGREVEPDLLAALVAEAGQIDYAAAAKELLARQIFETTAEGQLRFTHDKLREAAYGAIPAATRRAFHKAAAVAMEARAVRTATLSLVCAALAYHFSEAGEVSRAVEYLEKAGEQAHKNFANHEAAGFFKQAIAVSTEANMPIEPLRRARWERHLGSASLGMGRLVDSLDHLRRAVEVLGWPMPRSRPRLVLRVLGEVVRQVAHRLFAPLILGSAKRDSGRYREAARAYDLLMPISYYVTGDLTEILYATVRNLNVAELAGPSPELALAYGNAHATTALIPAFFLARVYGGLARKALDGLDDRLVESWIYAMNGVYCTGIGRFDEALGHCERIVKIAEEIRFPRRLEEGWALRGTTHLLRGDLALAKAAYQKVRVSAERGDPQTLTWGVVGLAHVAVLEGEPEAARQLAEEGARLLMKDLGRPERIYTYGTLALAYLRCGDFVRARGAVDQAAGWIAKGTPVSFYNIHSYSAVAEVYLGLWERASGGERVDLQARLSLALKQLHNCARVFPAGRSREWYWRGNVEARAGRTQRALRDWQRAHHLATLHGLAHDGALAEAAIAAVTTKAGA